MIRQHKIAIVGAGLVGGSAALFACYSIPGVEIVLIDVDPVRAEGQVLDLAHAAAIWRSADFRAGDYPDASDADIVVITAGAGVKKGQTRLDLVQINSCIVRDIVDQISRYAPDAIYLVASNPCDVLAHVVYQHLGLPRERVISTGTELDTARLRTLLSERLGVVAHSVYAYMLGEHGESAIIHWSGATVSGMPLEIFLSRTGKELSEASRDLVLRSVHEAAKAIKEGKGATHYGNDRSYLPSDPSQQRPDLVGGHRASRSRRYRGCMPVHSHAGQCTRRQTDGLSLADGRREGRPAA
jgi:L-lactate dehydrogenase